VRKKIILPWNQPNPDLQGFVALQNDADEGFGCFVHVDVLFGGSLEPTDGGFQNQARGVRREVSKGVKDGPRPPALWVNHP
jgi:hypothetical protein